MGSARYFPSIVLTWLHSHSRGYHTIWRTVCISCSSSGALTYDYSSSKYPLTVINKLINTYGGNLLIAYDIGCSFDKTLHKSIIANKVATANVCCAIPSFHGWAHNCFCQLNYHPLYIQGTGIEDYEICEKMFSFTNGAASVTQHATGYH